MSNKHAEEMEDWSESDSESSYSSYYSDSDSSVPDWDSSVDERTGEVLYIECHPFVTQNARLEDTTTQQGFSRTQNRLSTRGKFLKLLRRRESKRYSRRVQKSDNANKVKFHDFQEGEEREVTLRIKSESHSKDKFLIETMLGVNISTLSDGLRLMVAGFVQDGYAKYEKNIKIGDWLKSVNGIDVNFQNLNSVLEQLSGKTEVLVKLQRVAGVDVTKDPPINVLNNQSTFVKQLTSFNVENDKYFQEFLSKFPAGFACLKVNEFDDNEEENHDILYCYPKPIGNNPLCKSKGIFLTLNHLLKNVTNSLPKLTSIMWNGVPSHVAYSHDNNFLLLLMLPDRIAKPFEIDSVARQIQNLILFEFKTLENCFTITENIRKTDQLFSMFFGKMFNSDGVEMKTETNPVFEHMLPALRSIDLPNEAIIQVDDALTELEACDYREWNTDPLDCQRIFTMLGSAWFHSGYLIASHLNHNDLLDIYQYCKYHGLIHLSRTEPLKTLVSWTEVYPKSCEALTQPIFRFPESRRYLLIVGSGKDLLAVLMESGGSTEPPEENAAPDPFYVEEAQATLSHLEELGIPEIADRYIAMNPGPRVTIPTASPKKKQTLSSYLKSQQGLSNNKEDFQGKKTDVTSILKRRNNQSQTSLHTSTFSLSEDVSEGSEDMSSNRTGSDESDNEINDGSQMSSSSFDLSELKHNLLTEMEDVYPTQITTGCTNVLYHYLQFDGFQGMLINPPDCNVESQTRQSVITNFEKCCQKIHKLFKNAIRFKNMPSQEMVKTVNKSLIAIKEYGAMFDCYIIDEKDFKKTKISYWVIGRLFFNPHPKELYVCYNDSIPQNLIELAFKMNMGLC